MMRSRIVSLALLAALLFFAPRAIAQDDAAKPPLTLGDFDIHGSATGGYRFTDVKGYQPQFQEMFNLGKGFRLLDFDFSGTSENGKNAFADEFSLQLSGLGGDPFPTAQFTISKKKLYDLRVNWRQSYYYWNQNDNVTLPIATLVPALGKTGLTSNHDWATVRKFGSIDLTLHATNNLRFNFNYYRPSDEGTTFTTRSLDFLDSPGYWGTFARANPYYLLAPLSDDTNRITGGLDYTLKSWSFHYNVGYQTFTENINLSNVTAPELSIDPVTSSTLEPLSALSWSQYRKLTTPISEFSFLGKPLSRLEWRGGYMFYRYQGPATFDQSFNGIAPNAGGVQTPYSVSQSGRVTVTEPNHIIDQGLTYHLFHWWSVDLDYRYSRFTSNSVGNLTSLFDGTTPSTSATDVIWRDGISDLRLTMDFQPFRSLILRPGVQLLKADVETLTDGVVDPSRTLQTKTARPIMSFGYEPSRNLTVRGDFHSMTSGSSYTAITPHTQQGGRLVLHYQPFAKFSIEDEVGFANNKLLDTNFINNTRSNTITASYSLGPTFSVFGAFSYSSFFAQGNIIYARGAAPLADFLRDQEVNRVWQGGIEVKPVKHFGLRLSGNFDNSSGVGQISGEPPAYGPVTWPLVTGTVWYDLPRAGQFAVDLQRTYYIEQIVQVNNFSANLLTIRWIKAF
jgi:hypothetical protein